MALDPEKRNAFLRNLSDTLVGGRPYDTQFRGRQCSRKTRSRPPDWRN